MKTHQINKIKIEVLPNDFPCRKKIADLFQDHLWDHPFWSISPEYKQMKKILLGGHFSMFGEIKIFMDDTIEGGENHSEWMRRFNLLLLNITLWSCMKDESLNKSLKKVLDMGDGFPYDTMREKDFDFKKFSKFLNHEIGRIIDMRSPKFLYWKTFGYFDRLNEKLTPKSGPIFVMLWDIYISGRLSRKKAPLLHQKKEYFAMFEANCGFPDKKFVEKIWNSNSLTYDYFIKESLKLYRTGKIKGDIKY